MSETAIAAESLSDELARLVREYDIGERQNRQEAWNLIADLAVENCHTICAALAAAQRVTQCSHCEGKGQEWFDPEGHPEVCQWCNGTGREDGMDGDIPMEDVMRWLRSGINPTCRRAADEIDRLRAALAAAQRVAASGMSELHAKLVAALDGHTEHSRDCHLSGQYLAELVMPIIHAHLAAAQRVAGEDGAPYGFNTTSNARFEVKLRDYKDKLAGEIGSSIEAKIVTGSEDIYAIGREVVDSPLVKSLLASALVAESRAALALSPGKGEGWREIESAPKDGTPILIWQPGPHSFGNREQHRGFDQQGNFTEAVEYDDKRWAIGYWRPWGGWGNRNSADVNPSHWMPLPSPPISSRAEDS